MIVEVGEKLHIIYRALYEGSTRMHVVGEVTAVEGALCRVEGHAFIYDKKSTSFTRKTKKRATVVNLAEGLLMINIINNDADLEKLEYKYVTGEGIVITDSEGFVLNINEFGLRS